MAGYNDLEIAKKLLDQQGEINRLKAVVGRVRAICEGDKTAKDAYDLAADILIALDAPTGETDR